MSGEIRLAPISVEDAKNYFMQHSAYRGEFNLAIAAKEFTEVSIDNGPYVVDKEVLHGVIALRADGDSFSLGHISTDGNAQIGSLLYGGAWRVAKALGYETIRI